MEKQINEHVTTSVKYTGELQGHPDFLGSPGHLSVREKDLSVLEVLYLNLDQS